MKKIPLTLAATTLLALALTACGEDEPPAPTAAPTIGVPAGATTLTGTYTSAEGMEITLGEFTRAGSGPTAQPAKTPYVRFELTLTNHTGRSLDLDDVRLTCRTGASTTPADPVRDNGLGHEPGRELADGKKDTTPFGCAMGTAEKNIVIEIDTGEPQTALFAGEVTAR